MRRLGVVLAVALLSGPAPRAGGQEVPSGLNLPPYLLLVQKSVQEELKLTPEQAGRVAEEANKSWASYQELRQRRLGLEERRQKREALQAGAERVIADILKPNQFRRFQQISWQLRGAWALLEPEPVRTLGLTDEQKQKLQVLLEDADKEVREITRDGRNEETQKKARALRKRTTEKAFGLLTDAQRARLKELQGEPFKGEIRLRVPTSG